MDCDCLLGPLALSRALKSSFAFQFNLFLRSNIFSFFSKYFDEAQSNYGFSKYVNMLQFYRKLVKDIVKE